MTGSGARKSVLILSYSDLSMDARVLREATWLATSFDVTAATFGSVTLDGVEHIELEDLPPYQGGLAARFGYALQFMLGLFGQITRRSARDASALQRLSGRSWDIVIANDADTLPLAGRIPSTHGVLADLHEYGPRQAEESLVFRLTTGRYFRWILRRHLPAAARSTTVSEGIAEEYQREFGVRPQVVANAAAYVEREPAPVGSPIRLVHSAAPSSARRIETMIEAVRDTTADVTLDLYLVDNGSDYLEQLKSSVAGIPRVRVLPPVPSRDLIATLAAYDVGVHLLPPINFNHRYALPNKLFDFVQARLGIIIGPSPEMARIVSAHGLGAVTDDFNVASLTRVLDALDRERVEQWKRASNDAARELSGESQLERLESIVRELADGVGAVRR